MSCRNCSPGSIAAPASAAGGRTDGRSGSALRGGGGPLLGGGPLPGVVGPR
jgi:hypothetical protein